MYICVRACSRFGPVRDSVPVFVDCVRRLEVVRTIAAVPVQVLSWSMRLFDRSSSANTQHRRKDSYISFQFVSRRARFPAHKRSERLGTRGFNVTPPPPHHPLDQLELVRIDDESRSSSVCDALRNLGNVWLRSGQGVYHAVRVGEPAHIVCG